MIQWNETLATGNITVDSDHKQLIATLNELESALQNGAAKEQIGQIIAFLNRYAREHFAREEAHMLKVGCPAHRENCEAHKNFVAKLNVWVDKLNKGASTSLSLEVHRETAAWIRAHIIKVDCQLRNCKG